MGRKYHSAPFWFPDSTVYLVDIQKCLSIDSMIHAALIIIYSYIYSVDHVSGLLGGGYQEEGVKLPLRGSH